MMLFSFYFKNYSKRLPKMRCFFAKSDIASAEMCNFLQSSQESQEGFMSLFGPLIHTGILQNAGKYVSDLRLEDG
jgi:hypothetical protein